MALKELSNVKESVISCFAEVLSGFRRRKKTVRGAHVGRTALLKMPASFGWKLTGLCRPNTAYQTPRSHLRLARSNCICHNHVKKSRLPLGGNAIDLKVIHLLDMSARHTAHTNTIANHNQQQQERETRTKINQIKILQADLFPLAGFAIILSRLLALTDCIDLCVYILISRDHMTD